MKGLNTDGIFPVAFLPYLKVSVSPTLAWAVDVAIEKTKVMNWSFVNQRFVLQKSLKSTL